MTITRSFALTAALALIALSAPATSSISIVGSAGPGAFNPNPITIASGDSVAWTNNDITIHRIVLDNGSYDSGNLIPGSSSAVTAAQTTSGTFHCVIHPSMTGTITVNAPCSYTLSAASLSITAGGGVRTVDVTAAPGCPWTAVSNNAFITVTAGASGSGNGTVSFSIAANPSPSSRSGTITIAGQTFTVTQGGAACPGMTLSPLPSSVTIGVPVNVIMTGGGGTPPYASFVVQGGALPPGLTLSSAGVLSGTPTQAGTYGFTIAAADSTGCPVTQAYTLVVLAPAPALPLPWLGALAAALVAMSAWMMRRRNAAA